MDPTIPQLTPAHAAERTHAIVLDVREAAELADGRIPGSTHIPLGQLAVRAFELDRTRPVIAVCRSGGRSSRARTVPAGQGYEVSNLDGGMTRWVDEGRPVV